MTLQFVDTSMVAQRFQVIPEVKSIFEGLVNGAKTFWIVTSNETYDDSLMDKLLSIEEQILDSYPGIEMRFEYIPAVLCNSPEEIVSASAMEWEQEKPIWDVCEIGNSDEDSITLDVFKTLVAEMVENKN